jgi:hypothetical protein
MTVYEKCRRLTLRRYDWVKGRPAKIDPGMNFFILMIEQLGGKTMFSCEGHGRHEDQPYLMFYGPLSLAAAIAQTSTFVVEVQDQINYFALRPYLWLSEKETMEQFLRRAARAWVKAFGSPDLKKVVINPTLRKKKATPF